jgi:FMN phosphatase YigB (HAD superfamily)
MVAAHLYDLQGAARAGMKTIYIPRGDEQSNVDENSVRSKAEGGEVDLVVKSFVELADVLG